MTSTPHDALFKTVFQQPEHAAAELRHVLAKEVVSAIDWSSLTLEPGSFVDEALADQHSDLLFSAKAQASDETVLVYLLFEHQSTNDPKMALRLLGYMVGIWRRFGQEHPDAPLPLIVPAVLAQVPGGWRAPTRFSELFSNALAPWARAALPDFSYAVDDLAQTDDDSLQQRELAEQARLALWMMRDARDGALLLRRLVKWAAWVEALAREADGEQKLGLLLRYLALATSDMQLSEFRAILRGRAPVAENVTMTIAEQLRAEGEARGISKGRTEGKAEALLVILKARGLHLPDDMKSRITACDQAETLDEWIARAATAETVDEVLGD